MDPLKFLFCWLVLSTTMDTGRAYSYSDLSELHNRVLENYNKDIRPVEDQNKATMVNISFSLISVNGINELTSTMAFTSFISVSWTDEHIRWDPFPSEIYHFLLPEEKVWRPKLLVTNPGGSEGIKKLGNSDIQVRYIFNGIAIWTPLLIMETMCEIDITYFPFDKQHCHIAMVSWMTAPIEVLLLPASDEADLQYFQPNGEWDVTGTRLESALKGTNVLVIIELERKPLFLVINIFLPIIFLGIINPLVFILPVDCGERISFSITILLSFAVFMTVVSDRLPATSQPHAFISFYLLFALVYSVAILVLTVLTLRLYFRTDDKQVPGYVRKFLMFLSCRSCRRHEKVMEEEVHGRRQVNMVEVRNHVQVIEIKRISKRKEENEHNYFKDWKEVALLIDFMIFVATMLVFVGTTIGFLLFLGLSSS